MKTRIRYTETLKQVLGIITIPLVFMGVFLWIVLSVNREAISEILWTILLFGGIIFVIAASVFSIFRFIMQAGEAFFDEEGVHISLSRSTFLFPHKEFFIPFSNISSASLNTEPGKGVFISLQTKQPNRSLMIFPENYGEPEAFTAFWQGLEAEIGRVNRSEQAEITGIIKSKSFYDNPWLRGIAWLSVVAAIVFTCLYWVNPESFSGLRLIWFYCYAISFCSLVLVRRK